MSEVTVHKR